MRPRANSKSKEILDRSVTLSDLQQVTKSIESSLKARNELISSRLDSIEERLLSFTSSTSFMSFSSSVSPFISSLCPCGLTQQQLDLYQWVDRQNGKCFAKYLNSDGKEMICGGLYTSHANSLYLPSFHPPLPPVVTEKLDSREKKSTKVLPVKASKNSDSNPEDRPPISQDIKTEAAAKIQRLASRRRAWKTAEAEREWKV
jgi:hypothetical protein